MRGARQPLSVRGLLFLVGLAGLAYVGVVSVVVARVLGPAASDLESRTRDVLSDHDAVAASLWEMRDLRRALARHAPPFRTAGSPPGDLDSLRLRVRDQLERGAAMRASIESARLPSDLRVLLALAVSEETTVGTALLEATRAIELGRPEAAIEPLRASGVHSDSASTLLSAAQRQALQLLLVDEAELLANLRRVERIALGMAFLGVALFAAFAWIVHTRLYGPIRTMERAVTRIAAGDLATEVAVERHDELGRLSRHLNAMTALLRERAAEQERQRENLTERFGRILDESASEILLFDAGTLAVVQANRGARVHLGYARDELGAVTLPDLLAGIDRTTLESHLQRLRAGKQTRVFLAAEQVRRDGTSYPVELTLQYSDAGDQAVFVAVAEDAGVRHRVRELDRELRDFALAEQRVLNGGDLPAALRAITAMAGTVLSADACGVWRPERNAWRCLDHWDAASRSHADGMIAPAAAASAGRLDVPVRTGGREVAVLRVERQDASQAWTAEERTFAGAVADLVARAIDASERRALETALAQAQRMDSIGQLAGGVAHDFNNILTAILGNLEHCRAELGPGDPVSAALDEAEQAARRAADLTHQLLTFARHQKVEERIIDVNGLTRDADRMLRRLVGATVEIRTELTDGLPPVRMGQGQLEQVLVNLVVNARDAMLSGGTITIRTRAVTVEAPTATGQTVELAVQDTGAGMTRETLERVFEPFFTTKALGEGTGLGLAVCYGIVRQAGGEILADSTPGRGSTFRVRLPAVEGAPAIPAAERERPAGGHETILLVEDERAIRELLARALTRRGYRVLSAMDGIEAMEQARMAGTVDLLVTDVVMPRMGGPDLALGLRAIDAALPVLFMSGYTAEASLDEGALAGAEFIGKPFTPDELCRRVRILLDRAPAAA